MVEGCDLVFYDNWNYSGNRKNFSRTGPAGDFADRDVSAQLVGGCHNTSYLVLEHPWNRDNGGWGYLMGKRDKVDGLWDKHRHQDGQRYWKTGKQGNEIIRINIPTENRNAKVLRHTLDIHGRRRYNDTNEPRLHIRRESEQSGTNGANSPEQLLRDRNDKGQPCPGGEAYWLNATDGQKNSIDARTRKAQVACVYRSEDGLKNLHSSLNGSNDIRTHMYNDLVKKYCDRADRLDDVIKSGGGVNTCRSVSNSKEMAKQHCKQGDRIKSDKTFCTVEELGQDLYDELATDYCEKNPSTDWCSCYNVMKHKDDCRNHADLPGCEDVADQLNMMADSLPADAMSEFKGNEICWGSCVGTDRYIPHKDKLDPTGRCNREVCINVANITAGNLTDSGINLDMSCVTCDGGGKSAESSSSNRSETEAGVINDTKTAEDIMNRERFYEKSSFKWGSGAAASSSSCLLLLIIILVMFL